MKNEISLELLNEQHANAIFELTIRNKNHLKQWLPWVETVRSIDDTLSFINGSVDRYKARGVPSFAIVYFEKVCGIVGFNEISKSNRFGTIGYWLATDYLGKGIMTHAVNEVIKIGFQDLGLNRVEIRCAEGNIKSRAIAARLGFAYEGTLRQSEWLYEKFVDLAVYSKLASEHFA